MHEAFENLSYAVFADGALPERTKELIAVAVAHVTQRPYCINGHTRRARRKGASPEESMEAIWVAAEMGAGGGYARVTLALRRESRGNWRRARRRERSRPASVSAAQRYCGRDRIRTCVGNAGDFTGRSADSPGVPGHPRLVPDYRRDVREQSIDSFGRHPGSPPVPSHPGRPGVGWRESGGKPRPQVRVNAV